jgi:hypothetical protein
MVLPHDVRLFWIAYRIWNATRDKDSRKSGWKTRDGVWNEIMLVECMVDVIDKKIIHFFAPNFLII